MTTGPRTSGTGGSFGLGAGSGAGTSGGSTTGAGAVGLVAGAQEPAATTTQQQKPQQVEPFISNFPVARRVVY
jgi:hypothetical protein